jgi:hypothetical protein
MFMGQNKMVEGQMALSSWSTPMLKGRLVELVREMKARPVGKKVTMTELSEWAVRELVAGSADPRQDEAVAIAQFWLKDQRR